MIAPMIKLSIDFQFHCLISFDTNQVEASTCLLYTSNLRNAGKSILMCTHDLFRAKAVADRVGIMKEGRLVMLRSREEFLQDDLERIYLDYMQEAILE